MFSARPCSTSRCPSPRSRVDTVVRRHRGSSDLAEPSDPRLAGQRHPHRQQRGLHPGGLRHPTRGLVELARHPVLRVGRVISLLCKHLRSTDGAQSVARTGHLSRRHGDGGGWADLLPSGRVRDQGGYPVQPHGGVRHGAGDRTNRRRLYADDAVVLDVQPSESPSLLRRLAGAARRPAVVAVLAPPRLLTRFDATPPTGPYPVSTPWSRSACPISRKATELAHLPGNALLDDAPDVVRRRPPSSSKASARPAVYTPRSPVSCGVSSYTTKSSSTC